MNGQKPQPIDTPAAATFSGGAATTYAWSTQPPAASGPTYNFDALTRAMYQIITAIPRRRKGVL